MVNFHGTPLVPVIMVLGLAALVVGMVAWSFYSYHHQLKHYEEPSESTHEEKKPICRQKARVLEKKVELVQTGTSKAPSHHMECTISFLLEDGKTTCIQVPWMMYEEIQENEQGELVTEGEKLLDFNQKFGASL